MWVLCSVGRLFVTTQLLQLHCSNSLFRSLEVQTVSNRRNLIQKPLAHLVWQVTCWMISQVGCWNGANTSNGLSTSALAAGNCWSLWVAESLAELLRPGSPRISPVKMEEEEKKLDQTKQAMSVFAVPKCSVKRNSYLPFAQRRLKMPFSNIGSCWNERFETTFF